MPFVKTPGLIGKLYIPEPFTGRPHKHPCRDCFCCQQCSDERCTICRHDPAIPCRKAGPTSRAPGPDDRPNLSLEAAEGS